MTRYWLDKSGDLWRGETKPTEYFEREVTGCGDDECCGRGYASQWVEEDDIEYFGPFTECDSEGNELKTEE
ncbi:hypothetical protein, partial [Staphylococcus aureus]